MVKVYMRGKTGWLLVTPRTTVASSLAVLTAVGVRLPRGALTGERSCWRDDGAARGILLRSSGFRIRGLDPHGLRSSFRAVVAVHLNINDHQVT